MSSYPLAADPVVVPGVGLAIFVLVMVFAMVAYTDRRWFVATGVAAVLVVGLGAVFSWASLADHPLAYREGDFPETKTELTDVYTKWELKPGETIETVLTGETPADADHFAGDLALEHGCDDASRVEWHLFVDGDEVDTGALRDGQHHDLTRVAVPSKPGHREVRVTASRQDSATCTTVLYWTNPGFEGPGNGEFRFIFPGFPDT